MFGVIVAASRLGLRKPYLMPSDAEVERFTTGLLALRPAEIDELAQAAGLG